MPEPESVLSFCLYLMEITEMKPECEKIGEQLLVILKESDTPLTIKELAQLIGTDIDRVRRAKDWLVKRGDVHQKGRIGSANNPVYLGPVPVDTRNRVENVRMGTMKSKPFTGVDWNPEIQRPGCQDFLQYPSRRADGHHPHRAPLHGCVGNLADKQSNTRD